MREILGVPVDTSEEARSLLIEKLRSLTPGERFRRTLELTSFLRGLIVSDIKKRYPQATESEFRFLFARRLYGSEIAEKFFDEPAFK